MTAIFAFRYCLVPLETQPHFKVMGAAKKFATEKVAEILIANSAPPGATEARIQSQISAERLAYEATEIFMNETAPHANMTADEIRTAILTTVTDAVSA